MRKLCLIILLVLLSGCRVGQHRFSVESYDLTHSCTTTKMWRCVDTSHMTDDVIAVCSDPKSCNDACSAARQGVK